MVGGIREKYDPEPIWEKEIAVAENWIQYIDDAVMKELPGGTKILSISKHGRSYWTRTAEVAAQQQDGSKVSFFLKVTENDTGKGMVFGEFVSMSTLYRALPTIVPRPIAWGTYNTNSNVHFFLCEFVTMTNDVPEAKKLGEMLAILHKENVSPNGKYGFSVPTYQGTIPQRVNWQDTWEEFFHNLMERILKVEAESQGPNAELEELTDGMLTKVIPRLLRPLETGGRQIKPCLLHGDIWDENTSQNVSTSLPIIYDATCLYAHNEMEMAPWRPMRHKMAEKRAYIKAYTRHFPPSAPEEDFDDRNNLYCMRFNICCSALYPGNLRYRKMVMDDMRHLVDKHKGGYEQWAREHGELES